MEQQFLIKPEEECFHRMTLGSETSLSQWILLLFCCEGWLQVIVQVYNGILKGQKLFMLLFKNIITPREQTHINVKLPLCCSFSLNPYTGWRSFSLSRLSRNIISFGPIWARIVGKGRGIEHKHLLSTRYVPELYFTWSSQWPLEVGIVIPILQTRNPRSKEIK